MYRCISKYDYVKQIHISLYHDLGKNNLATSNDDSIVFDKRAKRNTCFSGDKYVRVTRNWLVFIYTISKLMSLFCHYNFPYCPYVSVCFVSSHNRKLIVPHCTKRKQEACPMKCPNEQKNNNISLDADTSCLTEPNFIRPIFKS